MAQRRPLVYVCRCEIWIDNAMEVDEAVQAAKVAQAEHAMFVRLPVFTSSLPATDSDAEAVD
jgi:hypothetical protein